MHQNSWQQDTTTTTTTTRPTTTTKLCSIGGGPGYDFVAAALVATYRRLGNVDALVLDYEPGWCDLVDRLTGVTNDVLGTNYTSSFAGCDITQALSAPVNAVCREAVPDTHMFLCQYCVAENYQRLQESDYVFFRELLQLARPGAALLLTETTNRLWPDLYDVVQRLGPEYTVAFPYTKGFQMMIHKQPQSSFLAKDRDRVHDLVNGFRQNQQSQDARIRTGFQRQKRRVRGAK